MTAVALGHVMDISEDRPASFIATAEDAVRILWQNGSGRLSAALMATVHEVRMRRPALAPYLSHPIIIRGIADGRCSPPTLLRWLEELEITSADEDVEIIDAEA